MIIARQQANQDAIMDIGGWLRSLGLEQYEATFRANAIEADVLQDLTDQDLEKLGIRWISSPGLHRRRLSSLVQPKSMESSGPLCHINEAH